MGISSMFQYYRQSNFLFRRSLFFLALFGIIHGITEWLIMFNRSQIFDQIEHLLFFAIMFLYGISFFALMYFAYHLLDDKRKYEKIFNASVISLVIFWFFLIYLIIHINQYDLTSTRDELRLITRYLTAVPAGSLTVIALVRYSKKILNSGLKRLATLLNVLAGTFFFYTIFTGLIAETFNFFPANIINSANFYQLIGIPIEIFRIMSAIIISVVMFMIIADFELESEEKRRRNQTAATRAIERRKMGSQLHDIVLQKLFSLGMSIDSMTQNCTGEEHTKLVEARIATNQIMDDIRDFLRSPIIQHVDIDDFQAEMTLLIESFKNQIGTIHFNFNIPLIFAGTLDSSTLQGIIYIVREFTLNTIKHAHATTLEIDISSNKETILILLKDDGIGFDITEVDQNKHFGIISIKSRVARCRGEVVFTHLKKGSLCKIKIPWSKGEKNGK
jgi:signal transduction histidine kinase